MGRVPRADRSKPSSPSLGVLDHDIEKKAMAFDWGSIDLRAPIRKATIHHPTTCSGRRDGRELRLLTSYNVSYATYTSCVRAYAEVWTARYRRRLLV